MTNKIKAIKKAKNKREVVAQDFKQSYNKVQILKELSRFELKGNIIDQGWFTSLVNESGKVQANAIFVLSEIVYWYRPTLVFDEETANIKALKAKFSGDILQKSYEQLAEKFGLTKIQVRDACKFLEGKGLIVLDFRTITLKSGRKLNNVLHIGLNIDELRKISVLMNDSLEVIENIKDNLVDSDISNCEPINNNKINYIDSSIDVDISATHHPIKKNVNSLLRKKLIPYSQKSEQPIKKNVNTNTKNINTEINSTEIVSINQYNKINNKSNSVKLNKDRLIDLDIQIKNNGFKSFKDLDYDLRLNKSLYDYPYSEWIDTFKKAIWEMYYYDDTKIKGIKVSKFDVISKLQNLNIDMVTSIIDKVILSSEKQVIGTPVAFIKTTIFNEIDEYSARLNAKVTFDMSDNKDSKTEYKRKAPSNIQGNRTSNYSEEELENIAYGKREKHKYNLKN